jgi:TatD DNase family protein
VEKFNKFNVYYAIGGKVTYPNAQYLQEAVKYIPKNRLVLETDAP